MWIKKKTAWAGAQREHIQAVTVANHTQHFVLLIPKGWKVMRSNKQLSCYVSGLFFPFNLLSGIVFPWDYKEILFWYTSGITHVYLMGSWAGTDIEQHIDAIKYSKILLFHLWSLWKKKINFLNGLTKTHKCQVQPIYIHASSNGCDLMQLISQMNSAPIFWKL